MDRPVVSSFTFMRAGTLHAEAERKLSQSVSEALSTAAAGTTLLALCDDEGGITRRFVSSGDNAKNRAFRFATSLNASSTPDDLPEDLTRLELRRLAWVPGRSSVESETQAGTALQAVADAIDANLLPGDWVAMSVRAPSRGERASWQRWLSHQRDHRTHHSMRANSKVVSVWAGSDTAGRADLLIGQLMASLGGFDLIAFPEPVTRRELLKPWTLTAVAGIAVMAAAFFGHPYVEQLPDLELPERWWWLPLGAGLLTFAIAGSIVAGYLPNPWTKTLASLRAGLVPAPPRRLSAPKPPRKAGKRWVGQGDERREIDVPASDGDWPLARSTFMVGPELIASVVLPGASSTGSTASRRVPPALAQPIGPAIGDSDGVTAHLSRDDMWAGTLVLGDPGSGKSKLLEWLVGEAMAHTGHTSQAGIVFDTKRDGKLSRDLGAWAAWASERSGRKTTIRTIHLADPSVPIKLDIFGRDGTLRQRAERIIDAMRYVEGDGIGARSKETLQAILPLAMLCTREIALTVPGVDPDGSVFHFARVLAGGLGDTLSTQLYAAIESQSTDPERARRRRGRHPLRRHHHALGPPRPVRVDPQQARVDGLHRVVLARGGAAGRADLGQSVGSSAICSCSS